MLPVFLLEGIGNPAWVQNYLCTLSRKQHIFNIFYFKKSFINEILISMSMFLFNPVYGLISLQLGMNS